MFEDSNHDRRRFLGTAVMTLAGAELVMIGSADAQSSKINPADSTTIRPGTNRSFGSQKQIDAGVLNVRYGHCRHIQPYGRHLS